MIEILFPILSTGNLTLKWSWALWLLPLPFFIWWFSHFFSNNHSDNNNNITKHNNSSNNQDTIIVPFFQQLSEQVGDTTTLPETKKKRAWFLWLILYLSWILLVIAVSRPTLIGEKIPIPIAGRDIMMAIDLSGSMIQKDLKVNGNRLDVVKVTADEFINRRVGDRVGLIFFSDRAYLQSPLTFDRQVVRELLAEANVGLTGRKTAIGDAIAIGLKRLRDSMNQTHTSRVSSTDKAKTTELLSHKNNVSTKSTNKPQKKNNDSQVLILLTDGANNAGITAPDKATEIAKKLGIKIYTIGVGSTGQVVNTPFGRRMFGGSDLDEKSLKVIAQQTGGQYFRATDMKKLEQIYQAIDKLEPIDSDEKFLQPEVALYFYPAICSLVLFIIYLMLQLLPLINATQKE